MKSLVSEIYFFPESWRLILRIVRLAVAVVCLGAQLLAHGESAGVTAFAGLFVLYSAVALFWSRVLAPRLALLALLFETGFFLAFASYGVDNTAWLSSFLYLYLLLWAVVTRDWGDVFIVVGVTVISIGVIGTRGTEELRRVVMFAGLLACLLAFQKRKLQEYLADSARREKLLHEQIDKACEAERQRIAGDFHDGPLQTFIGFQVRLNVIRALMSRNQQAAMEDLASLQELCKSQVGEIRAFLRAMRPSEYDGADLMAWTRRVVEEFQKDTGIPARFLSSEAELTAPPEVCRELVQILREALHNVQKHSQAARVMVSVERAGSALEIAVDDNGSGFAFSGSYTLEELDMLHLGPQSIKRRVRNLGGELLLESRPGRGAGLKIRVPA